MVLSFVSDARGLKQFKQQPRLKCIDTQIIIKSVFPIPNTKTGPLILA